MKDTCKTKTFTLHENEEIFYAKLEAYKDYGINMQIREAPKVRVKAQRPTKEYLKEMAEYMSSIFGTETYYEWLSNYSKGMNSEIKKQLHEIRKSIKRIQSFVHCIKLADELKNEYKEKT